MGAWDNTLCSRRSDFGQTLKYSATNTDAATTPTEVRPFISRSAPHLENPFEQTNGPTRANPFVTPSPAPTVSPFPAVRRAPANLAQVSVSTRAGLAMGTGALTTLGLLYALAPVMPVLLAAHPLAPAVASAGAALVGASFAVAVYQNADHVVAFLRKNGPWLGALAGALLLHLQPSIVTPSVVPAVRGLIPPGVSIPPNQARIFWGALAGLAAGWLASGGRITQGQVKTALGMSCAIFLLAASAYLFANTSSPRRSDSATT